MKKFLFALAAVAVMVACGGEKEKTPEERAKEFAQRAATCFVEHDTQGTIDVNTAVDEYEATLDAETAREFRKTFQEEGLRLIGEKMKNGLNL